MDSGFNWESYLRFCSAYLYGAKYVDFLILLQKNRFSSGKFVVSITD